MMKAAVTTWSFQRYVTSGKMHSFDLIALAKELGFEYIEFCHFALPEGESHLEFAKRAKAECDRLGLVIVAYSVGADFIKGKDGNGNWESEVERMKYELECCKALGAPVMRHDVTYGWPKDYKGPRGWCHMLPDLIKGCRALTELAEPMGIKTCTENHGSISQDSVRVEELINGVAHPNYGALIDSGNFTVADEPVDAAVARMAQYCFHVHGKDMFLKSGDVIDPGEGWGRSRANNYIRGAIYGHGDIKVAQCIFTLARAGYDGSVALEFEGMEDPMIGVRIGKANLERFISMAYEALDKK